MANKSAILIPTIIGAIIIGILGIVFIPHDKKTKDIDFPLGTVKIDDKVMTVEVADEPITKRIWLMFRDKRIPYNSAMLLVYDNLGLYSIRMLNIQYNLDLLWFDEKGNLVYMKENVEPCKFVLDPNSCTYKNILPSKYVMASTSGFIKYNNITINSSLAIISI